MILIIDLMNLPAHKLRRLQRQRRTSTRLGRGVGALTSPSPVTDSTPETLPRASWYFFQKQKSEFGTDTTIGPLLIDK